MKLVKLRVHLYLFCSQAFLSLLIIFQISLFRPVVPYTVALLTARELMIDINNDEEDNCAKVYVGNITFVRYEIKEMHLLPRFMT